MPKRVLCLVTDGFEEIEMVTPVDLLRRAAVEVTIASLHGPVVTGRCGVRVGVDAELSGLDPEDFDALFIPGGPGVGDLRKDGRPAELAAAFHGSGKPVFAICAAPLVLKDAGLLGGKRFTAHFSTADDLPGTTGGRVEKDDLIVTSRGAGTALDFGLALVRELAGAEEEKKVAEAIMA